LSERDELAWPALYSLFKRGAGDRVISDERDKFLHTSIAVIPKLDAKG
jgi:hypothetical protein